MTVDLEPALARSSAAGSGGPAAPKRVIVVPDGMADDPQDRLAGKTPVEAALTPYLDRIARQGTVGLVTTVPDGMATGSDVANLSVFGYDPAAVYTGRAPLEAAGLGVELSAADVAYRCNLVTISDGAICDPTADYIATGRARGVVELLNRTIGAPFEFYAGTSFRCLMVWRGGSEARTTPAQDIVGRPFEPYLPRGEAGVTLRDVTKLAARAMVGAHAKGRGIWLWGQGRPPLLPSFVERWGLSAVVVAGVHLVKGIGACAGCEVPEVPGATGFIDTDYAAKARVALAGLRRHDLAYIHIEAPDEASHMKRLEEKIKAIEAVDREIVGRIMRERPDAAVLVLPDHYTSVATGLDEATPVPFAFCDAAGRGRQPCEDLGGGDVHLSHGVNAFGETAAARTGLRLPGGVALMDLFLQSTAERSSR